MRDLVTGSWDWNWQILQQWIPQGILDKRNIQPPNEDLDENDFMMDGMVLEGGSIKHFYSLIVHHDQANVAHN